MVSAMIPIVVQVWLQQPHSNCLVAMVTRVNPLQSKADWCKLCIFLRSLNVCHFEMFEDTGLKIMALRQSSMAGSAF
jgi:hypothetical protein